MAIPVAIELAQDFGATDHLKSYGAAKRDILPSVDHRQ
jgi:hypothetical protein